MSKLFATFTSLLTLVSVLLGGLEKPEENMRVEVELRHAQTYYWIGMEEGGNMRAFRRSRDYLQQAERLLQPAQLPDSTIDHLNRRIETLRQDISLQEEIARDTFYGVFPLSRFLTQTLFADATSTGTFELADDPAVMAVTSAAYDLRQSILEKWALLPQINVVVRSEPRNLTLESEVFYVFNESPKLFARSQEEVAAALPPSALDSLRNGLLSENLTQRLCEAFRVPRLLVVTVHRTDRVDDIHFYTLTGKIYEKGDAKPQHVLSKTGFSRDRRAQQIPIVLGHFALLLLGLAIYVLVAPSGSSSITPSMLTAPVAAFAAGRLLPWALVPLLRTITPIPETLAKLSFWWPVLVGLVLFAAFPALIWFLSGRFQVQPRGRAGGFFVAVVLGICAYFLTPQLLWAPQLGWLLATLTIATLLPAAYILGRTLDHLDQLPISTVAFPIVIGLAAGASVLHANWILMAFLALISTTGSGAVLWWHTSSKRTAESERVQPTPQDTIPADTQALITRAGDPPYQRFDTFDEAKKMLSPFKKGRTVRLGLIGESGTGKTATARALAAEFCKENDAYVLRGSCPEPLKKGERSSYEPFQQALRQHFKIGILTDPDLAAQHHRINEALDDLFDTFVPFASLLFPSAEASANAIQSQDEIFSSIKKTLHKLAHERPIILFIDDVQWIDADSEALLHYLLDAFPVGRKTSLAILINSRMPGPLKTVGMSEHSLRMGKPTREQRRRILVTGLGLTVDTSDVVVEQVASGPGEGGELFWLLEVVKYLARHDYFEKTDQGFAFSQSVDPSSLPLPDRLREVLEERLTAFPEYRHPLACAACFGESFRVSALVQFLNQSRLDVLRLLNGIENNTGLICDVQERDDEFSFQSTYLLEGVRQHFSISGAGPNDTSVPQLVREYHARAAQALETIYRDTAEMPHDKIADHYFAAGASYAKEGKQACIEAARSSTALFNFDQARTYLNKARECAEALGEDASFMEEDLRVDCLEAHITGKNRREVAERGLSYINNHADTSLHLIKAVTQVCYDTGRETKDKTYFEQTARLAELLIEHGTAPEDRAEGHHFLSLSLSRKKGTRASREQHLREAVALLNEVPEQNRPIQRLRGRIMNSLAELLSDEHSTERERKEANDLFHRRISLNEQLSLGDRKGLAMTYGGLGRLLFYHQSDFETARHYFEKDLQIAQDLSDREGQVQMYSHIGACALRTDDVDSAQGHYKQSLDLAEGWISKAFALTGLIQVHARANDPEGVTRHGRQLAETTEWDSLFPGLHSNIEDALDTATQIASREDWYRTIKTLLKSRNAR